MIYDDLCSEFAEIVVFKAIQSFTDVRIGHLPSSSSNSNAWSTALCTKWNTINPVGKCGKGFLSSDKDHTFKCSQLEPKLDSLYCFGHFRCWVSLVCRQHGQQQTLWFALENHNGGSGTRFRGKKGGTVQELQETSDFKGQDFVAWPRWRLNHLARVLPIMMQNVKLSATGVTMPENMSPWPIMGYSLPRVYPAAHHSKSQEVRNHSKIVNFEQKHSWINLCCNHESVGKTCDWKLRSLSYLKLMHNSEMYTVEMSENSNTDRSMSLPNTQVLCPIRSSQQAPVKWMALAFPRCVHELGPPRWRWSSAVQAGSPAVRGSAYLTKVAKAQRCKLKSRWRGTQLEPKCPKCPKCPWCSWDQNDLWWFMQWVCWDCSIQSNPKLYGCQDRSSLIIF